MLLFRKHFRLHTRALDDANRREPSTDTGLVQGRVLRSRRVGTATPASPKHYSNSALTSLKPKPPSRQLPCSSTWALQAGMMGDFEPMHQVMSTYRTPADKSHNRLCHGLQHHTRTLCVCLCAYVSWHVRKVHACVGMYVPM